jgi:lysocardiolipin and lysophospholipid acyltransferase
LDDPVEMASPEEARAFELWLRGIWGKKEERLKRFSVDEKFGEGDVVLIRQM